MPFCPSCGAEVDQNTIFCMNCGKRLPQRVVPPPKQITWVAPKPDYRTPPPPPTLYQPYHFPLRPYHPTMKAPLFERCIALTIDYAITGILLIVIILITGIVFPTVTGALLALFVTPYFAFIYFCIKDGIREGQSIGKGSMKLRVVDFNSGRPATIVQSAVRNCCCGFCDWYCCYVTVLFDRDSRRIGDQIAGTVVIRDQ